MPQKLKQANDVKTKVVQDIARSLSGPNSFEAVTRSLLEVLTRTTGLEMAYLTRVDPERQTMEVLYTHTTGRKGVVVTEGAWMAWQDSLCKRALEDDVPYTSVADKLWPDTSVAAGLGVRTFMSHAVNDSGGRLLGTLCAVGSRRVAVARNALATVNMFARLLGLQIERDQLLVSVREKYEDWSLLTMADVLSGLDNPAEMASELCRALEMAALADASHR